MVQTKENFSARLSSVDKRHAKMVRRGYTTRVDRNGVIVAKPRKARLRLPIKGAFLMVLSFFMFKAFMLSANGPDAYADRLAQLEAGSVIEVAGARVLAVDPVTQFFADQMGPLFR
ncbi:hypothetical protein KDD17_10075 [Sulfitobacter albidus]|uniref:Uncharacterized protein n=1 Tax=Sulfitobacter albidus TaxID=2829501 RepID=A0A975JBQ9_9RHOB|nr:hypothetical protein [Sulfitobacter albidus]QUJ75341.1 hypothetical protein KDD17_10075 [Sulfitobacter albidus]